MGKRNQWHGEEESKRSDVEALNGPREQYVSGISFESMLRTSGTEKALRLWLQLWGKSRLLVGWCWCWGCGDMARWHVIRSTNLSDL